jgi:hypothetical protein
MELPRSPFGKQGKKKPGVSCLTPAEGIFRIP